MLSQESPETDDSSEESDDVYWNSIQNVVNNVKTALPEIPAKPVKYQQAKPSQIAKPAKYQPYQCQDSSTKNNFETWQHKYIFTGRYWLYSQH